MAVGITAATLVLSGLNALSAYQAQADPPAGVRIAGAACASGAGVTVAADFTPIVNVISVACVEPTANMTIAEAFASAGMEFEKRGGIFYDTLAGVAADYAVDSSYWAEYTSTSGGTAAGGPATTWQYGMVGFDDGPIQNGQAYLAEYNVPTKTTPLLTLEEVTSRTVADVPAISSYGAGSAEAQAAAAWLGAQLAANDDVLPKAKSPDWGLTVDSVLGLSAAGVGGNQVKDTAAKLWASGTKYIGAASAAKSNWAKTAKLVLALQAAGKDPAQFPDGSKTRDLPAELRGTLGADGKFGTSATAFSQSLGILALARSGGGAPVAAVSWLKGQRCADNGNANFGAYGYLANSCTSADPDTTAVAIQALVAAGVPVDDDAIWTAEGYLYTQQDTSGGLGATFGGTTYLNTNSTGLAAQTVASLAIMGDESTWAGTSQGYITGLQIDAADVAGNPKLKDADLGAIAYDQTAFDQVLASGMDDGARAEFARATAQAILGLGGPTFDKLTAAGAEAGLASDQAFTKTPAPKIAGTASVGSVLTYSVAAWNPKADLTVEWYVNGVATGVTTPYYQVSAADEGATITVKVTGVTAGTTETTVESAASQPVAKGKLATGSISVSGSAKVGATLTATAKGWPADATCAYSYEVTPKGGALRTESGNTFAPTPADAGGKVQAVVTCTKAGFVSAVKKTSAKKIATGAILAPKPVITGTLLVGETLTAVAGTAEPVGSYAPAPALAPTYQWYVGGKAVKSATGSTFTVPAKAKDVSVKVTWAGTGFSKASATSAKSKIYG
ncbi:MAG: terpene cyclase/mutase family protein [Propionibacteriaceae bacterium]|jgi:hypothetical protein|nr:terpene cyclase/mutase family protein [Propionibacteriaceae bacterium]